MNFYEVIDSKLIVELVDRMTILLHIKKKTLSKNNKVLFVGCL